ncbi:MAG: PH domain-containing protein [Actinomycetaceae bacterium]|nr:PH domain-containing protein [Actinomycetaceae bacterium]
MNHAPHDSSDQMEESQESTPGGPGSRRRRRRAERDTAVGSGVDASLWRNVHPLTPLAQTWAVIAGLAAFFTYQFADLLRDIREAMREMPGGNQLPTLGLPEILIGVAIFIIVVIAIAGLYSWMAWRRMSYAITRDAVYYRSGILSRTQRHARLNRIQAVNITHSLIGRLFKLGNIDIEVAGGADSSLKFGLLKSEDLEAVRREILIKVAEVKGHSAPVRPSPRPTQGTEVPPAADAPTILTETARDNSADIRNAAGTPSSTGEMSDEQLIYRVSTSRLLASIFMNIGFLIAILVFLVSIVGSIVLIILTPIGIPTLLYNGVIALSVGGIAWNAFAKNYGFSAFITADGIRIRAGLTSTRAQTIPPSRIHAVQVIQPFFWRLFGWYKVTISQAGFAGDPNDNAMTSVLLPVGTRDDMLRAVWMVYPDLGVDDPIGTLNFGIDGEGAGYGYYPNPERAKIFDWITWRRRAILLTKQVVVMRNGRITRQLTVLSYSRLQSAALTQGPLDRVKKLASIHFQLVDEVNVHSKHTHMDEQLAIDVFKRVTTRALEVRSHESASAWEQRMIEATGRGGEDLYTHGVSQTRLRPENRSEEEPEPVPQFPSSPDSSHRAPTDSASDTEGGRVE